MNRRARHAHRLGGALLAGVFVGLFLAERARPLRARVEPGARRVARNVAIGAITALGVSAIERPVMRKVVHEAARRRWGLLPRLGVSGWKRTAIALVLLDYTLYVWHVLLHRVPTLWRTHRVHHADRDLDVTTAARFHALEFAASVPWRALQVALIGVSARELALWQRLTLAEVMFHHSNLALPERFERALSTVLVTPRLHGLHHSIRAEERDSNFSSGLTLWDFVHRTFRAGADPSAVVIGLPEVRSVRDVTIGRSLLGPLHSRGRAHAATRVARTHVRDRSR